MADRRLYPVNIIKENHSVLLLFCAAFGGVYDVKHYTNVDNAVLVDIKKEELEDMKNNLYKEKDKWVYRCEDAFSVVDEYINSNRKFDIVNADPWSNIALNIWDTPSVFKKFYDCTSKYFVIVCTEDILVKFNLKNNKPITEAITDFIVTKHKINDMKCIDFIHRSTFFSESWKYAKTGGVYWAVFEKY